MDIYDTNEPHPALQPSSVNAVRALIDHDNSEDGGDNCRVFGTFGSFGIGAATSFAKPTVLDEGSVVNSTMFDDPAMAIGLALSFAKVCRGGKTLIPLPVVELLLSHVEERNAACALVLTALEVWGVVDTPPLCAEEFNSRLIGADQSSSTSQPDMSDLVMNVGGAPDA